MLKISSTNMFLLWLLVKTSLITIVTEAQLFNDFTLSCNPGYRLSAIRRVNSPHQVKGTLGSLTIECQILLTNGLDQINCEPLEKAPSCNGHFFEGCQENQWLGGFQVITLENTTNAKLLDPICCDSQAIRVDSTSCASERLNSPRMPFEHSLMASDSVYRGMQCWQQYNTKQTTLDVVWKFEVCQFNTKTTPPSEGGIPLSSSLRRAFFFTEDIISSKSTNNSIYANSSIIFDAPTPPVSCSRPCNCHCGIDVCANGQEPVRVIHKTFNGENCACDCHCRFECI